MLEAGHYAGSTSAGGPISFDVTDEGEVTNVIASVAGTTISVSQRFPLDAAGRWEGSASGRGVSVRMRGEPGDTGAVGFVDVTLSGDVPGRTQSAEWRARRLPALAY